MSHGPRFGNFDKSWARSFPEHRVDKNCPGKPMQTAVHFSVASCQQSHACPTAQRLQTTWKVLGAQFFGIALWWIIVLKTRANSSAFSVCRSLQTELSPCYFPRFPVRPRCPRFHLAPSQRSLQAITRSPVRPRCPSFRLAPSQWTTVSFPFMISSLPSRSLPTELSPSYFLRFPFMISSLPSRFTRGEVN